MKRQVSVSRYESVLLMLSLILAVSGVFEDGLNGYELKVFSNNTFDFTETIRMIADFMNEHGQPMKAEQIVMTAIAGGTLTSDGYVVRTQNMVINAPKEIENTNGILREVLT